MKLLPAIDPQRILCDAEITVVLACELAPETNNDPIGWFR